MYNSYPSAYTVHPLTCTRRTYHATRSTPIPVTLLLNWIRSLAHPLQAGISHAAPNRPTGCLGSPLSLRLIYPTFLCVFLVCSRVNAGDYGENPSLKAMVSAGRRGDFAPLHSLVRIAVPVMENGIAWLVPVCVCGGWERKMVTMCFVFLLFI